VRIVVTAGPTREYLDDVRFLSNPSSGRMGVACAQEALHRGHHVVLVAGPLECDPPKGVRLVRVESAREMARALRREFPRADALVMTAAVSDYRPARRVRGKIKKTLRTMTLRLVRNPDIVAGLARRKGRRLIVGFAVEARALERNALEKMRRKRLDLIVANSPSSFGAHVADFVILWPDGRREVLRGAPKRRLARRLLDILEAHRAAGGRTSS
jgi:phosphopantothenoylcysteine decarboxylase/phosphopantothenate--cysteine ligase